jgi:hypothetical protein
VTLVAPQFLRRVAAWTAAAADRDRMLARSGDGSAA